MAPPALCSPGPSALSWPHPAALSVSGQSPRAAWATGHLGRHLELGETVQSQRGGLQRRVRPGAGV